MIAFASLHKYHRLILFRHYWLLVATESREKAHEPGKISCVRSFGKVGRLLFRSLSVARDNRSMTHENMSGRDPLSQAQEENLLSEENESTNSSHQTGLADVLSAMAQMSSTMMSLENAMKRLAGAADDHATPSKTGKKPPAICAMRESGDSYPEKSDSEALNSPPNGDPPKLGSSVTQCSRL